MSPATIDLADIPAAARKQLGLKKPRGKRSMDMNAVRTYALRVLAVVAELTPAERARILRQALKVNDV